MSVQSLHFSFLKFKLKYLLTNKYRMSHSYQIDIDSSFRDRISYPDCGNFVIPINTSFANSKTPFKAKDPVLLGFPYDTGLCYEATGPNILGGFILQLSTGSLNSINAYVGSTLQIGTGYYTIIAYNHITKVADTLDPYIGPGSYPIIPPGGLQYTIRFERPIPLPLNSSVYQNVLPVNALSTTEVILGPEANGVTRDFLIGKYIYFQPTVTIYPWAKFSLDSLTPIQILTYIYQWALIKEYDPITKKVTLSHSLFTIIPAGTPYEILYYSYDNAQPLRYSGTDIFNNPRCCNISLANCQIPAYLPIISVNSGYITDYPYVYIAFYSERERTYNQPLMSMSPLSDRALFKVPISPNTDILTTKYLTLGGGITSQTVYFKHNDTFRFEIYLPNGQPLTFNPVIYDYFSGIFTYFNGLGFPTVSDPRANVQATFNVSFS